MAGYLDAQRLGQYATIGSKFILIDRLLKETNCCFEQNPDGCYRVLMIEFLNNQYLQTLADRHPSFLPSVENFQRIFQGGSAYPDGYEALFNDGVELYLTESYQYDIHFTIMMAAILCTCFSEDERRQYMHAFFQTLERWSGEIQGIESNVLLACALWGGNYENFRMLAANQYYTLKAQGFGQET